jgi:hypothetical protein
MQKKQKKKYVKPKMTQVKLDPKCAVLGFCKNESADFGNLAAGCGCPGAPCTACGS